MSCLSLLSPFLLAPHSFLGGEILLGFNLSLCRGVCDVAACIRGRGPRKGEAEAWCINIVSVFVP